MRAKEVNLASSWNFRLSNKIVKNEGKHSLAKENIH
jgi:hypothetical protein